MRRVFPRLVREVADILADPERSTKVVGGRVCGVTIGDIGAMLEEHPWRVVDAIEAREMLGWDMPGIKDMHERIGGT